LYLEHLPVSDSLFTIMNKVNLILGSQSPRRRQLLQLLNMPFTCMVADVDEDSITLPEPAVNVAETARFKAHTIAQNYLHKVGTTNTSTWILTADTTVALGLKMLNKPNDATDAKRMLQSLRNRAHEVHTGVVLHNPVTKKQVSSTHTAVVTMRNYSDTEIDAYVATGDPLDKAGAYAIQHQGFRPVAKLEGCFMGVMGLSICHVLDMMQEVGMKMNVDLTAVSHAHTPYAPCKIWQNLSHSL
jgi:septum formation protein